MVEIYRAQSGNGVVPVAQRRTVSIGSALSRSLGDLGNAAGDMAASRQQADDAIEESEYRIDREEQARERSRRAAGFAGALAGARVEYARWRQEAQSETQPGAPGWEERATEKVDELFGPLAEQWAGQDTELGQTFGQQLTQITGSLAIGELEWESGQRAKWEGEQLDQLIQTERDGLLGASADTMGEALQGALDRVGQLLDLSDHDGTTKARFAALARAQLVTGAFDGLQQQGQWDAMGALLQSGQFDGVLGNSKGNYLRTVDAGRAADARAAEQAQSAARDEWREARRTLELRLEHGEDIPASAIEGLLAQGKTLGVPDDELLEAGYLAQDTAYATQARGLGSAQLDRTIQSLQGRRAAGDLTNEEARQLDALERERGQRDTRKASEMPGLAEGSLTERLVAVDALKAMPEAERMRVAREGGAAEMGLIAALPPRNAAIALEGLTVLANNPNAYMPRKPGATEGQASLADAEFAAVLGPTIYAQLVRTPNYATAKDAALAIYAGYQARGRATGWNAETFRQSVSQIFGLRDGKGGLGTVRGNTVQLPDGMTASAFDQALSGFRFENAVYGDGSPAQKADVLKNYVPVYVGTDAQGFARYELHNPRGQALRRKGNAGSWMFRLRGGR